MITEAHYRQYLYGSARLGTMRDAQHLTVGGGPIGVLGNTVLRRRLDEPTLIIGGAGSGKGASLGLYQPVHPSTGSFLLLDMGGQYMSTTWHYNLAMQREAYALNVEGVSAYPDINHKLNLWGILKPDDPLLLDNARRIAAMAIRNKSTGDNAWVDKGAMRWLGRILAGLVVNEGRVTPARLWAHLNQLEVDNGYFQTWSKQFEPFGGDLYSTLVEIYNKKNFSEKEYGAIMGMIRDDLDWLASPAVAESVSGDEDYLAYLADPHKKVGIYYALKGGSGKLMESLTRMVVGIGKLHCMRAVSGVRPLFYLEEAATCGSADFIKELVSECRKYIDVVLVYQSQGQLVHLFGKAGAQEIQESCGMQIILGGGIRDIESARRYADMVGKMTLEMDDPMAQAERAYLAESARQNALWRGGNPLDAEREFQHQQAQSGRRRQTGRYAIDPAEIMRLNQQVLIFTPGAGVLPILANKLPPYWKNPAMAGRYGPDPLFPPLDSVMVQHRFWGARQKRFIREPVPQDLAHWPNHINGEIAYVKGYKTW